MAHVMFPQTTMVVGIFSDLFILTMMNVWDDEDTHVTIIDSLH